MRSAEEVADQICLALVIAIPKAIEEDGFVRYLKLYEVVKPLVEARLTEDKSLTDTIE